MGNRRDGSLSYSSSPSIFLQLSAMHFLPCLSATSSLLLSRAGEGAVGLQEPSMSHSSGSREGLGMAPLLPLCMTALMALSAPTALASPLHKPPASTLHSLLSEQLLVGLFQNGWLLARSSRRRSLLQMCTAVCMLLLCRPRAVPGCL